MTEITTKAAAGARKPPALSRRTVMAFALVAAAARPARAAIGRAANADLAVSCDLTLQPVLRRVAALFNARTPAPVHLFSAPPPLMLEQIERETQTDLLVTGAETLDAGARRKLIQPATRVAVGRNGLVVAGKRGVSSGTDLAALLGDGRFAVTDPTIAATVDGRAVLARLGLAEPLAARLIGAANTAEVVFLLQTGAARLGLIQRTDLRADPGLAEAWRVPDAAYPPITYGGAAAATAASPTAQAFLDFLATPAARSQLRNDGLEDAA